MNIECALLAFVAQHYLYLHEHYPEAQYHFFIDCIFWLCAWSLKHLPVCTSGWSYARAIRTDQHLHSFRQHYVFRGKPWYAQLYRKILSLLQSACTTAPERPVDLGLAGFLHWFYCCFNGGGAA